MIPKFAGFFRPDHDPPARGWRTACGAADEKFAAKPNDLNSTNRLFVM